MKAFLLAVLVSLQGCSTVIEHDSAQTYEQKVDTYVVNTCGWSGFNDTESRRYWKKGDRTIIVITNKCHSA